MARIRTSITFDGPFFAKDPRQTFRANVRAWMARVAELGESEGRSAFRAGEGRRRPISGGRGRVSDYVVGRVNSRSGKRWEVTAIVSVNTSRLSAEDAIAVMAAAAEIERRSHPMRKMRSRVRRARQAIQGDLLRGLQ